MQMKRRLCKAYFARLEPLDLRKAVSIAFGSAREASLGIFVLYVCLSTEIMLGNHFDTNLQVWYLLVIPAADFPLEKWNIYVLDDVGSSSLLDLLIFHITQEDGCTQIFNATCSVNQTSDYILSHGRIRTSYSSVYGYCPVSLMPVDSNFQSNISR